MSDRKRLESLWRDHYADVLAYASRRLGDDGAAGDVAAETFLIAWRRLDDVPVQARPWLFAVARRVIANARRSERRRGALVARLADERTDGVPEPDEAQLASVAAAFNRLGPADREVLSLVAWEGLKPREAAPVLGMSAALFSVRLHRAKRRLRKEMEQAGQERDMQGEGRESIRPDNSPNVVRLESR